MSSNKIQESYRNDFQEKQDQILIPVQIQNPSIQLKQIEDRSQHEFDCQCRMCNQYVHNTKMSMMRQLGEDLQHFLADRNHKQVQNEFMQEIIQRLILPNNKIVLKGIQVFIPEICYFKNGEADKIYLSKDLHDSYILKIKKDKITHTLIQKIFNERRRKYRDAMKRQGKKLKLQGYEDDKSKEKTKKSLIMKKQKRIEAKDAIVIRYTDGFQTLLSQNHLINLLLKRKQDPIWKKIEYIKNYTTVLTPSLEHTRIFSLKYQKGHIVYDQLFQRARILIQISAGRIIQFEPSFISENEEFKFQQEMKKKSLEVYSMYMLYQIVNFIELFYDDEIVEVSMKVLINQHQEFYILDVPTLQIEPLVKYSWTNEIYEQQLNHIENEKYFKQNIGPKNDQKADLIESIFLAKYENMKKQYDISLEEMEDQQEKINNQFFRFLYPNVKQDISQLVQLKIPLERLRKEYFGQNPQKKPIVKPFTNKFIRQLHDHTPRLRINPRPNSLNYTFRSASNTSQFQTKIPSKTKYETKFRTFSTFSKTIQV